MDREAFEARFAAATDRAVEIAASFLVEALPAERVLRVRLNSSYDGNPLLPGEVVHPEDSADEIAFALHSVDADTVVTTLWRDGTVPEWIDVAVIDETGDRTVVEVVTAGRFAADERLFYTSNPELSPFQPVGPVLPPDGGTRFSIHHRVECWTRADVDRLASFADQVIFLHLMTADLDADVLNRLPLLPALTLLDHHACALGSDALTPFASMPFAGEPAAARRPRRCVQRGGQRDVSAGDEPDSDRFAREPVGVRASAAACAEPDRPDPGRRGPVPRRRVRRRPRPRRDHRTADRRPCGDPGGSRVQCVGGARVGALRDFRSRRPPARRGGRRPW